MFFAYSPFVKSLSSFIILSIISYYASVSDFGEISLFIMVINFMIVFSTLGFDAAMMREYNETDDKSNLLSTLFWSVIMFSAIIAFAFIVTNDFLDRLLFEESRGDIVYLFSYLVFLISIEKIISVYFRVNNEGKKYFLLFVMKDILKLSFLLTYIFVDLSYDFVEYYVLIETVGLTIVILVFLFKYRKHFIRFNFDSNLFKKLMKFGLPFVPSILVFYFFESTDKLFINSLLNKEMLGLYSFAFRLLSYVGLIQTVFFIIWNPLAYRLHTDRKLYKYIDDIYLFLEFSFSVLIIVFITIKPLVFVVFDPKYIDSFDIFIILSLIPLIRVLSELFSTSFNIFRKTKYHLIISTLSLLVNVVLNYTLIPIYGLTGAAFSTLTGYFVLYMFRLILSNRLKKVEYSRKVIRLLLLTAVVLMFLLNPLISYLIYFVYIVCVFKHRKKVVDTLKDVSKYFS